MTNQVFRINGPRVIYEIIDGELILVHMERGTYYSTDEVGAVLWGLIEAGHTAGEMCDAIQAQYGAGPEEIAAAISAFLARLMEEDLIRAEASTSAPASPRRESRQGNRPFLAPVLHAYRDMQDMLSLDPIHDVEAAGWPVPRVDDPVPVAQKPAR